MGVARTITAPASALHTLAPHPVDSGHEIEESTKERREQHHRDPAEGGAHIVLGHGRMQGRREPDDQACREGQMRPVEIQKPLP